MSEKEQRHFGHPDGQAPVEGGARAPTLPVSPDLQPARDLAVVRERLKARAYDSAAMARAVAAKILGSGDLLA